MHSNKENSWKLARHKQKIDQIETTPRTDTTKKRATHEIIQAKDTTHGVDAIHATVVETIRPTDVETIHVTGVETIHESNDKTIHVTNDVIACEIIYQQTKNPEVAIKKLNSAT